MESDGIWRVITNALPRNWSEGYVHHAERYRRTQLGVMDEPNRGTALRECSLHRDALMSAGAEVVRLRLNVKKPDAVFVQDTACVVWDFVRNCWVVLLPNMGAPERRSESDEVETAMRSLFDDVRRCSDDEAFLEPGDLFPSMVCGSDNIIFTGRREKGGVAPERTNDKGVAWMRSQVEPMGHQMCEFEFRDSLHATTLGNGIGRQGDDTPMVMIDGSRASLTSFRHHNVDAPQLSPPALRKCAWGLNVQRITDYVVVQKGYPEVEGLLDKRGFKKRKRVPWTQLRLLDGSLTCCCIMQHMPI